ncbi:MAG TPA: hypothetical protein VE955_03730 [Candidatus Dormibacteraeota bacterium]|nr:hypothetical protein [Candidatus Dormibacteraeota bacterium]
MDIAGKLERALNVPRLALAFLAIILGIVILIFRDILAILVALFLIVWGLMEAVGAWGKTAKH